MKLSRLFAVMLALIMAMALCAAFAEEEVDPCDLGQHTWVVDKEEEVVPPTCSQIGTGLRSYKCSKCGAEKDQMEPFEIAATGKHDFSVVTGEYDEKGHIVKCQYCEATEVQAHKFVKDDTQSVAATCTAEGKTVSVCECGATKEDKINKTEHDWDLENAVVLEADCENDGYTTLTCKNCPETKKVDEVKALGHDYKKEVIVGCTESGYTLYTCQREGCGKTYKDTFTAPAGHAYVVVPEKAATCEEAGQKEGKKCSRCGDEVVGDTIPAKGHEAEVVKGTAATCEGKGTADYSKCSVCGKIQSGDEWIDAAEFKPVEVPALGHDYSIDKAGYAATCEEVGFEDYKICSRCGKRDPEAKAIPATGHTYGTVTEAKDATCTEKGNVAYCQCTVCEKYFQVIPAVKEGDEPTYKEIEKDAWVTPALGHKPVVVGKKDATCTEKGNTGATYCEVCDIVISGYPKEIPALGHDWEQEGYDWDKNAKVIKEATCKEDGLKIWICSKCTEVYEDTTKKGVIPADTDHSEYHIETVLVEPTCTETGKAVWFCKTCAKIVDDDVEIPALGHTQVDVEAVEPTATEAGHKAGTKCSVCGEILTGCEEIPATGEEKEYGKYSIENVKFDSNSATGKVIVTDGDEYDKVYARVTIWFGNDSYVVMRTEVIDGEFEVGYGVNNVNGITVVITTTKNCASVPMSSCNILAAYEK